MKNKSCLEFLGKKSLNPPIFKNALQKCFNIKNERILIMTDSPKKGYECPLLLSSGYYLASKELKLKTDFVMQDMKTSTEEADDKIIRSLENMEDGSVLISNMSNSTGNINKIGFRDYCKKRKFRFTTNNGLGSIPSTDFNRLVKAIDIDYEKLRDKCAILKKILDKGREAHITTSGGTDLYININKINAVVSDGNFTKPGTGGNIPAGEVYIAPNNVNGVIIIDGSSRNNHSTLLIKKPIKLKVEESVIAEIRGGKEAKELEKSLGLFKEDKNSKKIGEFGIGLNEKASFIGAMLVDEKAVGTAHIGIGSNDWFGGPLKSKVHFDQVFCNPQIFVDGENVNKKRV